MKNTLHSAAAALSWTERNHGIGSPEHLAAMLSYEEAKISWAITKAVQKQPGMPMENRKRLMEQLRKWTETPTGAEEEPMGSVRFKFSPRLTETGKVIRRTDKTLHAEFPTWGVLKFTLRADGTYRRANRPNEDATLEILLDPYGLL